MTEVKLLDAGYALQLQNHVKQVVDGHPLWTARFLLENPAAIVLTHRDFIRAGSQIIRSNSYQATVDGFIKHMGLDKETALNLISKSVSLAREAIATENKVGQVEVAGSVGPYGASLHNGSEYTGAYVNDVTVEELIEWHHDKVKRLVEAGVDLLAFETVPCSKEAVALIKLLGRFSNIKAWLSFSIKDEQCISDGEKLVDVIKVVLHELKASNCLDRLIAIGMNCTDPKFITPLLTEARAKFPSLKFIVYPNSGEHYNTRLQRWETVEGMIPVCEYVNDWLNLGARYVGGCCRTTDKDLPAIWASVTRWQASHKHL